MLKTLAEEKNITRTAERLFISQPSITYRLHALEDELKIKIVFRTPTGVLPTRQGEMLFEYAKEMLAEEASVKARLLSLENKVAGNLRIASQSTFANYRLPRILKGFLDDYPEVEISLKTGKSLPMVKLLEKGEMSLAIVRGDSPWSGEKYLLMEEPICLASSIPMALDELPNKPRIVYQTSQSLQDLMDRWWCENYTKPSRVSMEVDSMDTCRRMVVCGLGWALLPTICFDEQDSFYTDELRWRSGEPVLRRTWVIYQQASLELSTVRAFIDYLKNDAKTRRESAGASAKQEN
jgi:DNA-binding transcriptional LysR family regulator